MSKGYTSFENHVRVIQLHEEGLKTRIISEKTGVNQRTVQRIIRKFIESGSKEVPRAVKSPGRPLIISERGLRVLGRAIEANPTLTARQLKQANPQAVAGASVRNVQHHLKRDLHYTKVKARKKPLITAKQKKDRLNFARSYKDWDLAKWRQISSC
ncbi:uncharacterized protein [Palaemon carinicauda]|uniref:uncharacterized protein n=1 Tax=Palaemon carinicauda TaxID=392227 RepID=UPI0035B5AA27